MAKVLTVDQLEEYHREVANDYPLFPGTFLEYFNHEDSPVHRNYPTNSPAQLENYWACKFTFMLLVLAAEEELGDYPMEAS